MKKLILLLSIIAMFFLTSCSKDEQEKEYIYITNTEYSSEVGNINITFPTESSTSNGEFIAFELKIVGYEGYSAYKLYSQLTISVNEISDFIETITFKEINNLTEVFIIENDDLDDEDIWMRYRLVDNNRYYFDGEEHVFQCIIKTRNYSGLAQLRLDQIELSLEKSDGFNEIEVEFDTRNEGKTIFLN